MFAPAMFHNLGVDWAASLLGFLSLALLPFPVRSRALIRQIGGKPLLKPLLTC